MLVCFCAESVLADYIILFSLPAAEETALDDFNDEGCCLFLAHLRVEASSNEKKKQKQKDYGHMEQKSSEIHTYLRSLMVCPLKHGSPVSSIRVTKETTASM